MSYWDFFLASFQEDIETFFNEYAIYFAIIIIGVIATIVLQKVLKWVFEVLERILYYLF